MGKPGISALVWGGSPSRKTVSIVIVSFGIVLLCSIWIGLYFKVQSERRLEIDGAVRETASFARAFEEHTSRTIQGMDQTALSLKYQCEKEGLAIDIPRYMAERRLAGQPFVLLSTTDETGELRASSQVPFMPANIEDREHFLVHRDLDSGKAFISKPVLGRVSGKWSIQLTRRINKPDGSFGGIVNVAVDPFYFTEFYKQVDLGQNAAISLVGRDGIVRARESDRNADLGRDVTESPLMRQLMSAETGHYTAASPLDGVRRIYSYRAMKDYPLVVLVGYDERVVFADLDQRIIVYYWGAGGMTLIIGFFVLLLLVAIARQSRTAEELRQARDDLERKVQQRTQELFVANRELTAMNGEHLAMNEELKDTNAELQYEIADRRRLEAVLQASKDELTRKNDELTTALKTVEQAQARLIQQEKLAGIGQLAAGVAHEINNPLSFVTGNIEALEQYISSIRKILDQYRQLRSNLAVTQDPAVQQNLAELAREEKDQDLDFILNDLSGLFSDTTEGLDRMSKIVKGMRLFARMDQQRVFGQYDLVNGLESTLLVAKNEIKHRAAVDARLDPVPAIEAVGDEINQVLLNLIVNAAQAIPAEGGEKTGVITITSWHDQEFVYCSVADNGEGIAPENLSSIFNPFFTTKPVGQGTGIGLSISYDIIVNRHGGEIWVENLPGGGAKFTVKLPVRRSLAEDEAE
ncbi:MAG: ATP-binding protein [Negativicutes bacterium]|nr:ATP-binding protein [Negativicutes bacterium]